MRIQTLNGLVFDPSMFSRSHPSYLSGALLVRAPSRKGPEDFMLYAGSATELISRLKPNASDLKVSLVAREKKELAERRDGVFYMPVPVGVSQSLREPVDNVDSYLFDGSVPVNKGNISELANEIAHYYFVLYNNQKRFKAPGKVAHTVLDILESEVAGHLKSLYSRLLQTADCLEDWSLAAESLRAFIPGKQFRYWIDELVSLSLRPSIEGKDEIAGLLCQIPKSILQQNYELAAVQRDAYDSAKLGL